jgi:hypothetical protein
MGPTKRETKLGTRRAEHVRDRRYGRAGGAFLIVAAVISLPSALGSGAPVSTALLLTAAAVAFGLVCLALPWERVPVFLGKATPALATAEVAAAGALIDPLYAFFGVVVAAFVGFVYRSPRVLAAHLALVLAAIFTPVVADGGANALELALFFAPAAVAAGVFANVARGRLIEAVDAAGGEPIVVPDTPADLIEAARAAEARDAPGVRGFAEATPVVDTPVDEIPEGFVPLPTPRPISRWRGPALAAGMLVAIGASSALAIVGGSTSRQAPTLDPTPLGGKPVPGPVASAHAGGNAETPDASSSGTSQSAPQSAAADEGRGADAQTSPSPSENESTGSTQPTGGDADGSPAAASPSAPADTAPASTAGTSDSSDAPPQTGDTADSTPPPANDVELPDLNEVGGLVDEVTDGLGLPHLPGGD